MCLSRRRPPGHGPLAVPVVTCTSRQVEIAKNCLLYKTALAKALHRELCGATAAQRPWFRVRAASIARWGIVFDVKASSKMSAKVMSNDLGRRFFGLAAILFGVVTLVWHGFNNCNRSSHWGMFHTGR